LNSPNDVVVKRDGAIYFSDPSYGRKPHFGVPRPLQLDFAASIGWLPMARG
jgi:gluconolactonase